MCFGGTLARGKKKRQKPRTKRTERPKPPEPNLHLKGPIVDGRECRFELVIAGPLASGTPFDPTIYDSVRTEAIIDTGCTQSTVSRKVAERLKLPVVDSTEVITAGGTREVDVVAATLVIPIGNGAFHRTVRLGIPDDCLNEMLFGMDLLEGGVLTVDQVRRQWYWEFHHPRPLL